MATARTNQLPNASFTDTAGTAKSLKITSKTSIQLSSLEHRDGRSSGAIDRLKIQSMRAHVGLARGIAQLHTYGLPSNNAASRAEKI